ncbi:unnamed protein product [Peniophora sp. CBMAI 1063]|nr:unnamed protein product [Peniophora sp. CBMAI 1063]
MSAQYSALKTPESSTFTPSEWQSPARSSFDGETLLGSTSTKYAAIPKERASRPRSSRRGVFTVPMALHASVLAIYISLYIVWVTGAEQSIRVGLANASRVQTWLNLISHIIMLAFSTVIIAIMQPMATRSPFVNLPQSLTMVSDKITSWGGLGSALLNLYRNLSLPATLQNALIVTIYFSTLSGLGISSSFLFDVPAINDTTTNNMTTLIGAPSVRAFIPSIISNIPPNFANITFDWYRSSVGVGMLIGSNATVYPGLSANRIYDTLSPPMPASSNSTALVGYTDFNVRCGAVADTSHKASSYFYKRFISAGGTAHGGDDMRMPTLLSINYTLGAQRMQLYDSLSISMSELVASSTAVNQLWQPSDVLLRVPSSGLLPDTGRNLILYNIYNETGSVAGSRPILDSKGSLGSPWPLTVQHRLSTVTDETEQFPTGLMIQVIGCSLPTSTGQIMIDATTNSPLFPPAPWQGMSANSTWQGWTPDLTKSNKLEDSWASMLLPGSSMALWEDQPVPQAPLWSCVNYVPTWGNDTVVPTDGEGEGLDHWDIDVLQRMYETCHVPTLIEEYLTTQLFGASKMTYDGELSSPFDNNVIRRDPLANASLAALESALANATAMTMWSAARASTLTTTTNTTQPQGGEDQHGRCAFIYNPNGVQGYSTRLEPVSGSTTVTEQRLVGRIDFNLPALISGTILATVLTVLGLYMLARGDVREGEAPIEDAGLLCLMTLDNSAVAARLSQYSMHSSEARRRAGAFSVKIVDGRLVPIEDAEDPPYDGHSDR